MNNKRKKKAISALNTVSKMSSLIATSSTILSAMPIQHPAVTYAGYGGATCSLLTKLAEEMLRHKSVDNVRGYGKSTINAANRLFLLAFFLLDLLPTYEIVDKDLNLTPYKLGLGSAWFLTVLIDFLIQDSDESLSENVSIEMHTFSPARHRWP